MNKLRLIISILILVVFSATTSYAQQKKKHMSTGKIHASQQKGDEHFSRYEYYLAAQEYKIVVDEEPSNYYAVFKLAESYREYFDYASAEKYYKIIIAKDLPEYPLARFWYAITLRDNGNYSGAKTNFQQFLNEYKETSLSAEEYKDRARSAVDGLELAEAEMKLPQRDYTFHCLPEPLNTKYSEYSPVIVGETDSIVAFTSSREGSMGNVANAMLGGSTSDNYRYVFDGKSAWIPYVPVPDDNFALANSIYNESPGSFTKDGKKFYFTRCDEKLVIGKYEEYNCVIYVMKKDAAGMWTAPVRLNENINMKGQWNSQPSISPDGKILFFTSKRPGGIGMHDIWFSTCTKDDNWGPPSNLGQGVNTIFTDMSPRYYAEDRLLYFASNGHNGFGGLDIFVAKESENFETSTNIGMPFNSHRDDFYFVLGNKFGYLSSNRQGGVGNDDIYRFNIIPKEEAVLTKINADSIPATVKSISVVGKVVDDKGNKASNVEVALTDANDVKLKVTKTNDEGVFRFDNLATGNYRVVLIEKDSKVTQKISYKVDTIIIQSSTIAANRKLFENIYFDFNQSDLRPEAKKTLDELAAYSNKNPQIQIELNANTDGLGTDTYNRALSEKRGQAAIDYLIGKGVDHSRIVMNPLGKERPLTSNDNEVGRQLNRRVEFYILGGPNYETKNMAYVVEPKATLYSIAQKFNMTVEEIREINALSSDDVIPFTPLRVKRNVGDNDIIAQVSMTESMTTTDQKKNKKYYNKLAEKNAGIDASMSYNNIDIAEKNEIIASKNSEITKNLALKKAQQVSLKEGEDLYKVQPKNTLFSIGKLYKMSVDDIKTLNNFKYDTIYVNQLIKVKTGIYKPAANEYLVKEGDTLENIAYTHNVTVEQIMALNPIDGYVLQRNMILRLRKDE
jgi:peptidoglycan-associated lipoprotein